MAATEAAQSCCQSSACAKSGVFFIGNQKNCQLTMFSQKEQILSAFHRQLTANTGQALVAMNLGKLSVLCFNVQMLIDVVIINIIIIKA